MVASLNACGSVSFFQCERNKSMSLLVSEIPPDLNISAGIASGPGALPVYICLMALATSSTDGSASRSLFIST